MSQDRVRLCGGFSRTPFSFRSLPKEKYSYPKLRHSDYHFFKINFLYPRRYYETPKNIILFSLDSYRYILLIN